MQNDSFTVPVAFRCRLCTIIEPVQEYVSVAQQWHELSLTCWKAGNHDNSVVVGALMICSICS